MKTFFLFGLISILASCGTAVPVTVNPDRSTTTDGTAGSAQITNGATKEGMNTSKSVIGDSSRAKRDSLPR